MNKHHNIKYVILIALFVRLLSLIVNPLPIYDDSANGYYTYEMIKNNKLEFFQPNAQSAEGAEPLYRYILYIIFLFGLDNIIVLKLANVAMALFAIYAIYLIGQISFNKNVGLLAALLASFHPDWIILNTVLWRINLQSVLFLFGLYFFLKFVKIKETKHVIYSSVLFSLSIYTYTSSLVLGVLLPLMFLTLYKTEFYREKNFYIFTIIFLASLLPFGYFALQRSDAGYSISTSFSGEFWKDLLEKLFNHYPRKNDGQALFLVKNYFGFNLIDFHVRMFNILLNSFNIIIWIASIIFLKEFLFLKKQSKNIQIISLIALFSFFLLIFGKYVDAKIAAITATLFVTSSKTILDNKHSRKLVFLLVILGVVSIFFHAHIPWRFYGIDEVADTVKKINEKRGQVYLLIDEQMDLPLLWKLRKTNITIIYSNYPNMGYSTLLFPDKNTGLSYIPRPSNGCFVYVSRVGLLPDNALKSERFPLVKKIYLNNVNIINVYELCAE